MGDVGSMGLGALLSGLAVILHREIVFAVVGGVFLCEAVSVIIQVTSFKLFKRRIFRMTPLHHHFEMMGLSEPIVVTIFAAAGVLFAAAGIWLSPLL